MTSTPHEVTRLLADWRDGDRAALDRLLPIVYAELHRMAARYIRGARPWHTLQTSALVNEVYMRLADYQHMQWQDRAHFFAVAAQAMRRILVAFARARQNLLDLVKISWSPDGETIACLAGNSGLPNGGAIVAAVSVKGGTQRQLTHQSLADITQVAWLRDGSGLVMAAREPLSSPYQVWHLSTPKVRRAGSPTI